MTIPNKEGQLIQKQWEEMNSEEKIDVIRQGLGILINVCNATNQKLDRITKALEDYENSAVNALEIPKEEKTNDEILPVKEVTNEENKT